MILTKRFIVVVISILVASLVGLGVSLAMTNHSSKTVAPATLTGHWHQVKSGFPSMKMSADVSDNKINIYFQGNDNRNVFWLGTFNIKDKSPKHPFKLTSIGDQDAMASDILASTEPSKVFTYKNGDLSYEFSIMGQSTIVHLQK